MFIRGAVGRIAVFARDGDGNGVSGEAANITAYISLDGGTPAQTRHVNPVELDATNMPGVYEFIVSAAETAGDHIVLQPQCSTSGVYLDPVVVWTEVPDWAPTGRELAYSDYTGIAKWGLKALDRGEKATITLTELARIMDVEIGTETYTKEEFPDMPLSNEGRTKNIAYGERYRVECTCVDQTTFTWEVAGHAVTAIVAVYDTDGQQIDVTGIDLPNAQFVYQWDSAIGMTPLTADIIGKSDAGGFAMTNPADVKEDLLKTYGGLADADIDQTELATARASWKLGTDNMGRDRHSPEISLFIDSITKLGKVIEDIDLTAFGLTFMGSDGKWIIRRHMPEPSDGLLHLKTEDWFDDLPELDEYQDIITKVTARYAHNRAWADFQTYSESSLSEEERLRAGLPADREYVKDILTTSKQYARVWTSRMLFMLGQRRALCQGAVGARAMTAQPADKVLATNSRRGITREVFEIIAHDFDYSKKSGSLTLGNIQGFGDSPAFLISATQVFPSWLGGGSAVSYSDAWSDEKKRWWRQNCSGRLNSHEFITSDGTESGTELADTHRKSVIC